MLQKFLPAAFVAFAIFEGLFEGPAEIFCGLWFVIAFLGTSSDAYKRLLRDPIIICALLWALAGVPGAAMLGVKVPSEDRLRPLLGLALLAGAVSLPKFDEVTLRRAATGFAVAITLNAAYGFLQRKFGALPLDALLLKNPNSPQVIDPVFWGRRGVSGLFYNRIKLAHVGSLGLGLVVLSGITRGNSRLHRALCGLSALILATAIALTGARMAVAASAVALVITLAWVAKRWVAAAALVACIAGIGLIASTQGGRARIQKIERDAEIRKTIQGIALQVFMESPILGVGHGSYRAVAPKFARPSDSMNWTIDGHNIPFHTLAETGVIGCAAFFGAFAVALLRILRVTWSERSNHDPRALLHRFALYGLLMIMMLGAVHFPLHHANLALAFWTLLAVGCGLSSPTTAQQPEGQTTQEPSVGPADRATP